MRWYQIMNRTLYVTDLDGTLLDTNTCIHEKSLKIINELIAAGMHFTFATARSLISARKVTEGLSANIPVIVYNGAFIMNKADGEILLSQKFTDDERHDVVSLLREHRMHPLVYSFVEQQERLSWNQQYENEGTSYYLSQRRDDPRLRPLADDQKLFDGDMFYLTCIGEWMELSAVHQIIQADERFRCTLQQELYRSEYWLEIMPRKATKAAAAQHLKTMLSCDRIVAFGDAINDLPMFELADEAYAVENAVPELKAAATAVIRDNDHDGVAEKLWELYQKDCRLTAER